MKRLRKLLLAGLLSVGGCATVEAGNVALIHADSEGIWLARDATIVGDRGDTRRYRLVFYCRKAKDFPQCHSAEYYHGRAQDIFWPENIRPTK